MFGTGVSSRRFCKEIAPMQRRHRRWLAHAKRFDRYVEGGNRAHPWVHQLEPARIARLDRDAAGLGR